MEKWTAVLAGTPVDTQMGVDCLKAAGMQGMAFPLARDPREQTAFQISPAEEKYRFTRDLLRRATDAGCCRAFVYCNSLSAAVDFPALAQELSLRIVTPLEVYRELAGNYQKLAVIAANAQGLAGIERVLLAANPQLDLFTMGMLPLVEAIEAGEDPDALVERLQLAGLAELCARLGMQALVLGCTHFPYFKAALARRTGLPLVDPAQRMLELLEL